MNYQVDLETFHGPLDLLLYLVKRHEVDILDIPIVTLAEQFHTFLLTMQELDVELAGEFLVMAATLMEMKAKSLLPSKTTEETDEDDDPRRELVKQLLEYRRVKDAATALEQHGEKQSHRLTRLTPPEPMTATPQSIHSPEIWDLVDAFSRIIHETASSVESTVIVDDTPQHVYESRILTRLENEGPITFREMFTPPFTRSRLIGLFLALLELIKNQQVKFEQSEIGAEILLRITNAPKASAPDHEPKASAPDHTNEPKA